MQIPGFEEIRYSLKPELKFNELSGYAIGLLVQSDPAGIGATKAVILSDREQNIAKEFSFLVNTCVFGFGASPVLSSSYIALLMEDCTPDWCAMDQFVNENSRVRLRPDRLPDFPFIVEQQTSKQLYSVTGSINQKPSEFQISLNGWGKKNLKTESTLRNFYKASYDIDLDDNQPILLASIGSCVKPFPLLPQMTPVTQTSMKETTIYLVPQTVKVHPVTRLYHLLRHIPQVLFWAESGFIAKRVSSLMNFPLEVSNFSLHELFVSRNELITFESPLLSLTSLALTCPSAGMGWNYRKLEWIGDAALGYIVSKASGSEHSIPFHLLGTILSNENIGSSVARNHPFINAECVLSRKPTIKSWSDCRCPLDNINTLADISEALIGVGFLCGNLRGANSVIRALGIIETDEVFPSDICAVSVGNNPGAIKLLASLRTLRFDHALAMTLGEWDEIRQILISAPD